MCEATTIALVASTVLAAAGTAVSVVSSKQQADAQSKQYAAQAEAAKTEAGLRAQDRDRERKSLLGKQAAAAGASGITLDGSAMDIASDTTMQYSRDQYNDNFNLTNTVNSLNSSSANVQAAGNAQAAGTLLNFAANTTKSGVFSSLGSGTKYTNNYGTVGGKPINSPK